MSARSTLRLTPLNSPTHDVLFHIFNHIDLSGLLSFKQASRSSDHLVSRYLNAKFHAMLYRFVDDPTGFRGMMRMMNSVIAGACVTTFLLPATHTWAPETLTVYTTHSQFPLVIQYLHTTAHFLADTYPVTVGADIIGVAHILRMKKQHIRINVMRSETETAIHPLPFFWMTALMNYLSADFVCSAYPYLTEAMCGIVNSINTTSHGAATPHTRSLMPKYLAQGFTIRTRALAWAHQHSKNNALDTDGHCAYTTRMIGDKYCLHASLQPFPSLAQDITQHQQLTVLWRRGGAPCNSDCPGVQERSILHVEDIFTL